MPAFRLIGLDPTPFAPLFLLPEVELRARGIARVTADASPGYPCRVSLEDANIGDELLLLSHCHQAAASPYRASGPVFVRRHARRASLSPGQVPPCIATRLISLRGYDAAAMMAVADVCEGPSVASRLDDWFSRPDIACVHLHNARQGCFSCLAERAA